MNREMHVRTHSSNKSPVVASAPIIPMNRWLATGDALTKAYAFVDNCIRNRFVVLLLGYEEKVHHHAQITIDEFVVHVAVRTRGVDLVTEIDKEYAAYADVLYKDVAYGELHEDHA